MDVLDKVQRNERFLNVQGVSVKDIQMNAIKSPKFDF